MIVLFFVFSIALFCQVNTATVSGSVSDPAHALVPGAKLQLRNEATGAAFSTTSNSAGQFTLPFVPVGTYQLTASQPGFQDHSRRGISLSAGENLSLDIQLLVSTARQEVSVQDESPLINLASSEQHGTLSTQQVSELPLAKQD